MARRVVVLGEVLCDVFSSGRGVSLADTSTFVPRLGGAPANVAVQLARLGVDVALISAVGRDPIGARLLRALRDERIDTAHVAVLPGRRTGMTLVEVDRDGERRFYPFRENSADLGLAVRDVSAPLVRRASVLHTGTVSLRSASARAATIRAVSIARRAGALVSLDVNLRWGMFPSRAQLLSLARAAADRADLIKATRDEALALLDLPERAKDDALVDALLARRHARAVFLTLDARGAILATHARRVHVPAPRVRVVDATGAGDAFIGAAIAHFLESTPAASVGARSRRAPPDLRRALDTLDDDALYDIGRSACAAGSATVTRVGATSGMPRRNGVAKRRARA